MAGSAPHRPASDTQPETLDRMAGAGRYNAWMFERAVPYLGSRALDVGAGIGTFTEMLSRSCDRVVALEPDGSFADVLRSRFDGSTNVEVVEGAVEALDERYIRSFDTLVCVNVLEHIPDDRRALEGYRACLETGGNLLLLVPAHPVLYGRADRALEHARRYTRDELAEKLRAAGFATTVLQHVNPVGAVGWLVSGRVFRRSGVPSGPLTIFDRLVPLLRALDRVPLPFGLSLWAVARAEGHQPGGR